MGFQDFLQLVRDYGDKEAKVVINTVGNIFNGQIVGETANDFIRAFWKSAPKASAHFHQPTGCLYIHQYPDGQS